MRILPPAVARARDALFADADRHGPRWPMLVRRITPMALLLPLALLLAASRPWRALLVPAVPPWLADLVLVAPVLAALVLVAAVAAPLARVRIEPLLGTGFVLLAVGLRLVTDGLLVASTVPLAFGALALGLASARVVRRAVWTLPVLLAAGISDAQSVQGGVTSRLLGDDAGARAGQVEPLLTVAAHQVQRVDLLVLHLPAAGGMWLLGIVDLVAIGLLLGLAHLYWLPVRRTAPALAAALAIAVAFAVPVPVLPLLGVAWVAVHARFVGRSLRFSLRRLTYLGG